MAEEISDHEREELFELVNSSGDRKAYFEEMQNLWKLVAQKVKK